MKNKIVWKFLVSYLPLILLSVFLLNYFVSFSLRNQFKDNISERLKSNALLTSHLLSRSLQANDKDSLRKTSEELARELDARLTVIDLKGVVLFDSQENYKEMDNHQNRPEVLEAIANKYGSATRFSNTLQYNMEYQAVRISQNDQVLGVVRLSLPMKKLDEQIRVIYRVVLFGGIFTAILVIIIGFFISLTITDPISQMKETAERFSSGDFSRKVHIKSQDELGSLAQSLNLMAEKLEVQFAHLKKVDKLRADFVANVSHELKTPLTAIKGYVETLEDGALNDQENARKFVGIIKKHAHSLENIVDDLLTLTESDEQNRGNQKKIDVLATVQNVAAGVEYAITKKKQNLSIKHKGKNFGIIGDPVKIDQVFINVVDNAIKYTQEKGDIEINVEEEVESIHTIIKDNGPGIAKKYCERVFERFFRTDKARSRDVGGTGLGLAIVRQFVELNKGRVYIESDLGQGVAFHIIFPKG